LTRQRYIIARRNPANAEPVSTPLASLRTAARHTGGDISERLTGRATCAQLVILGASPRLSLRSSHHAPPF